MRAAIFRLAVLAFALVFSAAVWSRDLAGQWDLKVENKDHHVVTVLVVEFTEHQAQSCIGGKWLRVNVVSSTTEDSHFFPVSGHLSYSVGDNQLTIGRNEICDAYLWLRGALNDEIIRGEYFGFGWGTTPLGFFALSKRK